MLIMCFGLFLSVFFFFQAEDGIRDHCVTGVQTCALPICPGRLRRGGRGACGSRKIERHPAWALIVILAIAVLLWLIFAVWPPGLEAAIGRKRVFLNAVFNGITLGSLYFLVASGFTLIFGLMRNVNLAHGSLYLFGGYIGYAISTWTGSWVLGFIVAFVGVALVGVVLQIVVFRRMEGQDLRQTRVTIGLSIVFADLMLWVFGGEIYTFDPPALIYGSTVLPVVEKFPTYRIFVLLAAIVIG